MTFYMDTTLQMWVVFFLMAAAIVAFIREKISIEAICVLLLSALLFFGQFFPVPDPTGRNQLSADALLAGFANSSLIAVLALLVMGQAIMQTDALRPFTQIFVRLPNRYALISIAGVLLCVAALSAFMNNTPLVILAIPIVQALASSAKMSESRFMMPLSFIAILGGMTTLVGSSTNLLVSSALQEIGYPALTFFQFFVPGAILACIGSVYIFMVMPWLLKDKKSITQELTSQTHEFIAEIDISEDDKLVGEECINGAFKSLPGMNIRMIQRRGHIILPPFEGYKIEVGDIMIVAATRDILLQTLARHPGYLLSETETQVLEKRDTDEESANDIEDSVAETRILAEVMIPPASRYIDMTVEQISFTLRYGAAILGIRRRARAVRRRFGRVKLEPGDVLLVAGSRRAIDNIREQQNVIVLSGSKTEIPLAKKAPLALLIFFATIGMAATGVLSIPVAAISGAVLMIGTGCINVNQATRALDRKIFLLVGSMLALGVALQATDGARAIAETILMVPFADSPLIMASILFAVVAVCTNVLTNNACAILFTPIAVNMAVNLNVDPMIFAITVLFASNCSFASPIGYQTNLLVMGPGKYKFKDFIVAGVPLMILIWLSYIFVLKFYYGI